MRHRAERKPDTAEKTVRDIRRGTRRSTGSWRRRASSMRSVCPPIRFYRSTSAICSSARWGGRPMRSGGSMPASATRPRAGPSRGGSWPSIVTNLSRPAERVVAFYNQCVTAEQYIKEGKNALKWTRLSCRSFAANAVRLQLHALAYNLANFMRTLALPSAVQQWSLTTLREKLVKIGAKVISHGRYVTFQLAEVAVTHDLFRKILRLIDELRPPPTPA